MERPRRPSPENGHKQEQTPKQGQEQASQKVTFEIPEKAKGKVEPLDELWRQARRPGPPPEPSDLVQSDALSDVPGLGPLPEK